MSARKQARAGVVRRLLAFFGGWSARLNRWPCPICTESMNAYDWERDGFPGVMVGGDPWHAKGICSRCACAGIGEAQRLASIAKHVEALIPAIDAGQTVFIYDDEIAAACREYIARRERPWLPHDGEEP